MSQSELDRAIVAIRDHRPDEKLVRDASARVFRNLFDAVFLPDSVDRIRGCSDFQALLPPYLSRTLSPARALLVRDHTLQCVACRRALQIAQGREPEVINRSAAKDASARSRNRLPVMAWALAATLTIGIAAGLTGAHYGLLPGQNALRATVSSVEGSLYRVSDVSSTLIKVGTVIRNADELRTASGSRAILTLIGGITLEIGEQSDVSLSHGWRGNTVNLSEGRMIVQALDPPAGNVDVSTGGMVVPVKNVVLSVDRGTKGARVAVAEGSAQVEQGQNRFQLTAGQQMATDGLENVPIASEFAWSKNADSYLALLSEFSTLQRQFQSIPSPGLRYSSNLAKYVPENAVLYAAIPNVGGTIVQAKRIFDDRLAGSDVLREWWGQQSASHSADFDRLIGQISSVSDYLGNEIVFSIAAHGSHSYQEPLLLAEVRRVGLAEYLQQNMPPSAGVQIITSTSEMPAGIGERLLISITSNVLVASRDPVQLKRALQLVQNSASGNFTGTPFYSRIAKSYSAGAGYLLAIDLEQISGKSVSKSEAQIIAGVNNAQYLVLERRDAGAATDTRASLSFSGARQGVASWLGAPSPMGSLDFVSPDATFAISFIMKSPRAVVEELIAFATQNNPGFMQGSNGLESLAGVSVDDVAAPFGSDATFAIDGALLPIPSWKIAVEVNDPSRLQRTLTTMMDRVNQQLLKDQGKLQAGSEQVNGRAFYWLRLSKAPELAAYYTFVDGYLLAGTSEANLIQAIQNRQTGHTLLSSASFRNQMPVDGYTNFSGVVYINAGSSLGPLAEQLRGSASLSLSQRQSVSTLLANSGPAMICVYGEPERIVAATRGSFLGFSLGTLASIQQGGPLVPLIAQNARLVVSETPHRR
jgi:hypothetical protein